MKKLIIVFMSMVMVFTCSCGKDSNKDNTSYTKQDNIRKEAAQVFMKHYMSAVIDMDDNIKKSFYSRSLIGQIDTTQSQQEPHPVGYTLGDMEISGQEAAFKANLINEVDSNPDFSVDTYEYTLIKENGVIKINGISKKESMELIGEDNNIFYKKSDDEAKVQALSLDDLPEYTAMQSGISPEQKFAIPKDYFTSCGIPPEGENIIITTTSDSSSGCYIASVEIQEEKQTIQQGMDEEDQQGKDGQQDGGSKQNQEKDQQKRQVKVKSVDLIENCSAYGITFSPDNTKFAVGLSYDVGIKDFKIYDYDSGQLTDMNLPFMEHGVLSAMLPCFTSDCEVVFKVKAADNSTEGEKKYEGKWSYNLETKQLQQID